MALTVNNLAPIILVNTVGQISVTVNDTTSGSPVPTDPYTLTIQVYYPGGDLFETFTYGNPDARLVKDATGVYHFNFGVNNPNNETNCPAEFLFNWQVVMSPASEPVNVVQTVRVVPAHVMMLLPEFRLLIDKSRKLISEDPTNPCFLGYTDADLFTYLTQGLSIINAYQPYVTFDIAHFPDRHRYILLQAGLIAGAMSQQLFAIDTDIPNYNDQGTSFVITHQPQLAALLNQVTQMLDKLVPQMKLQYVMSGQLHVQQTGSYRLTALLNAAPPGMLFRNIFFSG